ncbi:MAG: hypothetical protein WCH46_04335 [bacterium]
MHRARCSNIVLTLLFVVTSSRCQSLLPESPISSAVAGANIASEVREGFSSNPALNRSDSVHQLSVGFGYTPFAGGLSGANSASAEASFFAEALRSSFTVGLTEYSFEDIYSDISFGLGSTTEFQVDSDRNAYGGFRIRHEIVGTTAAYPKLQFDFLDLGLTFDLTKDATLGIAALNLLGAHYIVASGTTERLPRLFLLGASYHPIQFPLRFYTAIEETSGSELVMKLGAEYLPISFLTIRLGTTTDTGNITSGIGLNYGNYSVAVSSRYDKALGVLFSFGVFGRW